MPNVRIFLLIVIGALGWSQAAAAPLGLRGCNTDRIRAELATGKLPSLTGCKPETVEPILSSYDYGLYIEKRVASSSIRSGRIVSQRLNDGQIYVDVSTGPERRSQSSEGHRTEGRSEETGRDRTEEAVVQFFGDVVRAIGDEQRRRPPPAAPAPQPPAPAPASDQLAEVLRIPTPVTQATTGQPTPTTPPITTRVAPAPPTRQVTTPVAAAAATEVKSTQLATTPARALPIPPADPALKPSIDVPPAIEDGDSEPPPPPPVQPSVFRIAIGGNSNLGEGDQLRLIVRRDRRDGIGHRLGLTYSDPSLLVSPPATLEFAAESPDEVIVPLQTAVADGNGDHELRVTLASDGRAEVAQPASVTAVILDRTPWWQKLLGAIGSLPGWVAALAAAGAAASAAPFLMPRATCSIGGGTVDLGPTPLKPSWPAIEVDAVIGEPIFSIPSPLPIGSRVDAEPSPA